ncbi:MAG: hypothetical protein LBQ89_02190 [Treponema sp.]|jgi:hypothetical protein|nr:hypothetical protein [Treponema sp.]
MNVNLSRIIYFEEDFRDITDIARINILWPCYAWKVAIPIRGKNNPFEELVLKLSAQGLCSAESIAGFLFPAPEGSKHEYEDLMLCVQSRLMARGYLDSGFEISNEGKKLLDQWDTEEIKYETAIVYQDWDSGRLLPAVHFGVPEYPEIIERDGYNITFKINDSDRKKYARIIRIDNKSLPEPSKQDVTRAFFKFKERCFRYGSLRKSSLLQQSEGFPDSIGVPLVQGEREFVYLHCQLLLDRDNPDPLVSDGFGLGYSDSFLGYLKKNEDKLLTNLRDKANKDKAQASADPDKNREWVARIPYSFKKAHETIQKWKSSDSPDNIDAAQNRKRALQNAAGSLYDALEFAFASLLVKYPAQKWINLLSKGRYGQYSETIKKAASRLGFSVTPDNSKKLLNEPPGAFYEIHNSDYKLQPLMILAILAASDERTHPCNDLANGFPDFFDFVSEFIDKRNALKHGDTSQEITINDLEELFTKTGKAIHLLFPKELPQELMEVIIIPDDIDSFREQRLKADFEIADQFGNDLLYSMEPNLRDTLYRLKMFKESDTDIVDNMYSGLQIALHLLTKAHGDVSKPEYAQWMEGFSSELTLESTADAVRTHALEMAKKYGLLQEGGQLPSAVKNVNVRRIPAVLHGGNISLQANCLALLALGSGDALSAISRRTPDLVQFAAQLADMRRHGNMAKIGDANLDNLEEKLFNTIKVLLEVTYGKN